MVYSLTADYMFHINQKPKCELQTQKSLDTLQRKEYGHHVCFHLEAWWRKIRMAARTTAKRRSREAEGGCSGPIPNGRKKSVAATTIIITIEPAPHPYSSILISQRACDCPCPRKSWFVEEVSDRSFGCANRCCLCYICWVITRAVGQSLAI